MFRHYVRAAAVLLVLAFPGAEPAPLLTAAQPAKAASTRQTATRPEIIKDRFGRTLGTIRPTSNARLEARDRFGRLLGTYDPKVNRTTDRFGRMLTTGNTLAALIVKAAESGKRKGQAHPRSPITSPASIARDTARIALRTLTLRDTSCTFCRCRMDTGRFAPLVV